MDIDALADALRSIQHCDCFDDDEARRVAAAGEVRDVAPGEHLMEEGAPGEEMLFLLDGAVEIRKKDPRGGDDLRLADSKAGDVLGEIAVLRGDRRLATVTATAPCRVFALGRAAFERLVADGDSAAYKLGLEMSRTLANRLAWMHGKVVELLQEERPAEFESFKRELLANWDV